MRKETSYPIRKSRYSPDRNCLTDNQPKELEDSEGYHYKHLRGQNGLTARPCG